MNTLAYTALLFCALLALAGCSENSEDSPLAETGLTATAPWVELKTRNSRYRIRIEDSYEQVPAGLMHYWDINVTTIDDTPV